MRWLDSITDAMNMNLGKRQKMVRHREAWRVAVHGLQRVRHDWAMEQQQYRLSDLGVWDKSGYIPGRFQKITVSEARHILPQESMRQYLSLGKRIVQSLPPT